MTDSELNEAVARKLGWIEDIAFGKTIGWINTNTRREDSNSVMMKGQTRLPNFATSIEAAWGIIEHLRSKDFGVSISDEGEEWCCHIDGEEQWWEVADKPIAKAIAMAFLQIDDVGDKKYNSPHGKHRIKKGS